MLSRTFTPLMVLDRCHHQYFVTDLAVGTEVDIRIFSAEDALIHPAHFFQARFLEVACLDLEALSRETGDELLQFLDLFFLFLVGFFHLLDQQLAGFVPEIIVAGIHLILP